MPRKFQILTEPAPPRVRPVGKLGIVDWREDCAGCHNCVKRACVYGFYADEARRLRNENGYLDYIYQCKGCLNCVQECTKGILTRVVNPEYAKLGNDYYKPDMVHSTWYQAETGKIPVSGSGYGGPFSGEGFDAMWTDMSEIVRPTRDGIHGREYISTSVDIGRRLGHLAFSGDELAVAPPPLLESPLPVMFDVLPTSQQRGPVLASVLAAAARIGIYAAVRHPDLAGLPMNPGVVPVYESVPSGPELSQASWVLVPEAPEAHRAALEARRKGCGTSPIVGVRVPATPGVTDRVRSLARQGVEVIQILFDPHGRELGRPRPRHLRDVIREVHAALVQDGTRDRLTLVSSGGVVLAEHVVKALLCGLDMVAIDLPLLVALECRLCGECARAGACPIGLEEATPDYAQRRIQNLMGAWHSQIIEMMGAMGIREARRLRGEIGRCMFFEDLEAKSFGRLFGRRRSGTGASA